MRKSPVWGFQYSRTLELSSLLPQVLHMVVMIGPYLLLILLALLKLLFTKADILIERARIIAIKYVCPTVLGVVVSWFLQQLLGTSAWEAGCWGSPMMRVLKQVLRSARTDAWIQSIRHLECCNCRCWLKMLKLAWMYMAWNENYGFLYGVWL